MSDRPQLGLIVGVANQRSIAWAIAEAMARKGARLAVPYAIDRLEDNVRGLCATLEQPLVMPCDVTSDEQLDRLFEAITTEFGGLDFVVHGAALALREDLSGSFSRTSRDGFHLALDVSCYSLITLAERARPLMAARGGGSILTLTYLGSERVFPHYNVMGVAKAALEATVRYLAADLGPQHIRVNAISAGPIRTLAALGIDGFSLILDLYRQRAPLGRSVEVGEVADAAAYLLSPGGAVTGHVLMVDAGFHVTTPQPGPVPGSTA